MEEEIADLETKQEQLTQQLTKANEEITKANAEITKANAEITQANAEITRLKNHAQCVKYHFISVVNNYQELNTKLGLNIGQGANIPKYTALLNGYAGHLGQTIKNTETNQIVMFKLS